MSIYFTCNFICLISFRFTILATRIRFVAEMGKLRVFPVNSGFFGKLKVSAQNSTVKLANSHFTNQKNRNL